MSSPCWRELEHVMLRLHTTIWSPCRRIWLCWGMNVECLRSMMDHNSVPLFLIREVKHWIPVDWFVEGTPLPFMMRRRWDFSYLLSTSDVVLRLCTTLMLRLWWLIRMVKLHIVRGRMKQITMQLMLHRLHGSYSRGLLMPSFWKMIPLRRWPGWTRIHRQRRWLRRHCHA